MKKFIAAFDSLHFSESTMSYAIDLARRADAHLVGAFLEDPNLHSYSVSEMMQYTGASYDEHLEGLNRKDEETRRTCIETFRQACRSGHVPCSVHHDRNAPLRELLHESIYADLLLLGASEAPGEKSGPVPPPFVRHLLQEAQCPVVLLPARYQHIGRIVLLYDGAPSSVHALRAFSYLFENLKNLETEVITVKDPDADLHVPDGRLMKEFVKRHFPGACYTVLKGNPDEEILRHLKHLPAQAIVVLGAYRRDALSRLFRPSTADVLLRHVKVPLFISNY
ncbi:universal stress protein [Flaviaesturariibacter terrae]